MTIAASLDPFAPTVRGIDEPDPVRAALRAAGPLVRAEAPAGGPVWIVTDDALARAVLTDPRIAKDPAWAPTSWDARVAGLEPPAAAVPSLTTIDGPVHARLRQAHAPLLGARRLRGHYGRMTGIARELLAAYTCRSAPESVDLAADFTGRYPLVVLLELLGVPLDRVDQALEACRGMFEGPEAVGRAMGAFDEIAASALAEGRDGPERVLGGTAAAEQGGDPQVGRLAVELRDRLPDGLSPAQVRYLLFGLIFPGQLTTDPALGFVLADVLSGGGTDDPDDLDGLVREVLRRHPPAPYTLWRFTAEEVELAGVVLPARSPVLVDVLGIGTAPDRRPGPDLSFGAGPHYCMGAQLAALELRAVAEVVRTDFPDARLAVPRSALRVVSPGGIGGSRLAALPVVLGRVG
jgi:cytochrome P450